MGKLTEIMKPYIAGTILAEAEYEDDGARLKVTLPKVVRDNGPGLSYRKVQTLVFETDVLDALVQDENTAGNPVRERVGNYISNVLEKNFRDWDEKNVQLTFRVGSEALDLD
ncbi:MAG: hypothetical protein Q7K57_57555 [Burkholderiaceae bacterium]|nr:hypothetical protein [Polaromonas sp.]MDO8778176.1 hypothetical protein [Burkholderiaceae bacterium]